MKKYIKSLLILSLILSCSKKAEISSPPVDIRLDKGNRRNLIGDFTFNEKMRAGSLIMIPNEQELAGVEFPLEGESLPESWEEVFSYYPFSENAMRGFDSFESNFDKVKKITGAILKISAIRDRLYEELHGEQVAMDKLKLETQELLASFPCYPLEVKGVGNKKRYSCAWGPRAEVIEKEVVAENCNNFSNRFNFIFLETPEDLTRKEVYQDVFKGCERLEISRQKGLDNEKEKLERLDKAKGLITLMMESGSEDITSISQQVGLNYVYSINGLDTLGVVPSKLEYDVKEGRIKDINLQIDFKLKNDLNKEYSLANKKLEILEFTAREGYSWLVLAIYNEEFSIKAELSLSIHEKLGLRLAGSAYQYPPGPITGSPVRRGYMKMEFSRL